LVDAKGRVERARDHPLEPLRMVRALDALDRAKENVALMIKSLDEDKELMIKSLGEDDEKDDDNDEKENNTD
jgi:hypothetical protein